MYNSNIQKEKYYEQHCRTVEKSENIMRKGISWALILIFISVSTIIFLGCSSQNAEDHSLQNSEEQQSVAEIAAIQEPIDIQESVEEQQTCTFNEILNDVQKQPLPSMEKILGQNLLVGFDGFTVTKEIRSMLTDIKPGGIVLYRRNIQSSEQLKTLIQELQDIAVLTTGLRYFIMLDEEPDGASRMGLLKNCFPLGSPFWKKIDQDVEILSSMGINTELAPVTDFPFNPNSFIKDRVPMKTPEELADFNQVFIQILHDHNMFATLKHFPGMGAFTTDPHMAIPDQEISEKTFDDALDLFRKGITANADFVMTAHAMYMHIDAEYPATLSHSIVTGILKKQLNFKGLIITDDLSDMALACNRWTLEELGKLSLLAGHHMILYSHKLSRTYDIFKHLLKECEIDEELTAQTIKNYQYVTAFKLYHDTSLVE